MGNLCGKPSRSDNHFEGQGRVLGSAPPQPTHASVPSRIPSQGPGRTLARPGDSHDSDGGPGDAKAAAARAAEERAQRAQGSGKLGRQLDAQKRQTRAAALEQASRENRLVRDADAAVETRNWN